MKYKSKSPKILISFDSLPNSQLLESGTIMLQANQSFGIKRQTERFDCPDEVLGALKRLLGKGKVKLLELKRT